MADDLAGVDQGELAAVLGAPHSDGGRDLVSLHRITSNHHTYHPHYNHLF